MHTNSLGSRPTYVSTDQSNDSRPGRRSALHIAQSIPAERQRVFLALTVPEFMESWLAIPNVPPDRVIVPTQDHGFSVRCLEGEASHFTIRCAYRACDSNKLRFDWKQDAALSTRPSLVTIRLMGESDRTDLDLKHISLGKSLLQWHSELWQTSLARLSSLFSPSRLEI